MYFKNKINSILAGKMGVKIMYRRELLVATDILHIYLLGKQKTKLIWLILSHILNQSGESENQFSYSSYHLQF